jgi:hypothetical protein
MSESLKKTATLLRKSAESVLKMQKFAKECEKVAEIAANFSWFIGAINISVLKKIFVLSDNEDAINQILVQNYTEEMEKFKDDLCKDFPDRATIINEACNAHLNQNYYSSIVLFLTQIDGISKIYKGQEFFQSGRWKQVELDDQIKTMLAYGFLRVYFSSENIELPIRLSERERKNHSGVIHINRHQIIHGETVDFNTKINSLKVFSLLVTLTKSLEWLKKQEKNESGKRGQAELK